MYSIPKTNIKLFITNRFNIIILLIILDKLDLIEFHKAIIVKQAYLTIL